MALPELYSFGRKGHWFGLKWFTIYMLDAVVQVRSLLSSSQFVLTTLQSAIIYFLILYTYKSTTSRADGFDVYQYEFSTVGFCWLSGCFSIS